MLIVEIPFVIRLFSHLLAHIVYGMCDWDRGEAIHVVVAWIVSSDLFEDLLKVRSSQVQLEWALSQHILIRGGLSVPFARHFLSQCKRSPEQETGQSVDFSFQSQVNVQLHLLVLLQVLSIQNLVEEWTDPGELLHISRNKDHMSDFIVGKSSQIKVRISSEAF